jgi:hypothetical protein
VRGHHRDTGGFKTTEPIAFVVVAGALLVSMQIVDGFDAQHAWFYVAMLTVGYMVSRPGQVRTSWPVQR